jgi:hypothetical protein
VLSQRQFDILKYIHRSSAENSLAPGMREISLTMGISRAAVVKDIVMDHSLMKGVDFAYSP